MPKKQKKKNYFHFYCIFFPPKRKKWTSQLSILYECTKLKKLKVIFMKFLLLLGIMFCLCSISSFSQLRLTCPNGGEKFVVGSDTLITWEGILPTDTVQLDYSIDNGITWSLISNKATGLQYIWKDIPKPTSSECLIKIQQISPKLFIPDLEWQKTYGGSDREEANCILQTTDGGYIVVGRTLSNNGDVIGNHGIWDAWILKLDMHGMIEWRNCYGGIGWDVANSVKQTSDEGYIISGYATARIAEGDSTGQTERTDVDVWVLKIDNKGDIEWQKDLGDENSNEFGTCIQITKDGGYIIAGSKIWFAGMGKNGSYYNSDILVIKLKMDGSIEWENIYNHDDRDIATSIQTTSDGGYIICGYSNSKEDANWAERDYLIIKLDKFGNIDWKKNYGGSGMDEAQSIQQTFDGGYIVLGRSNSIDGDITDNKGSWDYWVLKLDGLGNLVWQKNYGGSKDEGDMARSRDELIRERSATILQEPDSGFVFAGSTTPVDGDIFNNDLWVVKLDQNGNMKWDKTYGGKSQDYATSMQATFDGGYIIVGDSQSNIGENAENKGQVDYYIIKLALNEVPLPEDQSDSVFSIIAPQAQAYDIDMKKQLVGTPKDSLITDFISNVGECNVIVDSIYFSGTDKDAFKLLSDFPKYSLIPGESKGSHIEFNPNRIGLLNAKINIITQSDTLIRNIQGIGVGGILVSVKNDSANAGDIRRLKLIMSGLKPEVVANLAPNFSAKIRFQKTILTALKKSERNVVNDSIYMSLSGKIQTSNELGQFLVVAGLGTVEETTIDILEFILTDDSGNKVKFNIKTQPGLFKLLGICREGGTRLINPTGKAEIMQIIPNPASEDIEIKVNLIEDGATTLSIFNSNGLKVKVLNISGETGMQTIQLDGRDYSNGLYFIQLQTPTVVANQKLMIIK
jgi:hypothetical protein